MAASNHFGRLPATARSTPTPFAVEVPESKLIELNSLIAAGKVGPTTYEGLQADRRYGIDNTWLQGAKEAWFEFDWREVEDEINAFPNYKASISQTGQDFDIHFVGLFSERNDAVPILMLHGWPGSFMEFLPILRLLKQKYTPLPLPTILADVTLYWLTDSISTSLWPYRQLFTPGNIGAHENPEWYIRKPMGFSWFPREIAPVPRRWVETTGDVVFYREHDKGGHFAALEVPEVLLGDLEEFVGVVRGRGVL